GTPFQDKQGNWWCTAFYNADVPPLTRKQARGTDLSKSAQTINPQGVTVVPLNVEIVEDGDVRIRAADPDYAAPGPDENQQFD
ncbi:MAG: beta-xylosidase, partial [Planctomycetota bacterium]